MASGSGERRQNMPGGIGIAERWLSHRRALPSEWFTGSNSRVKQVRLAVLLMCVVSFMAGVFVLTSEIYSPVAYAWAAVQAATYVIIAIVFLLGLSMWYSQSELFFITNLVITYVVEIWWRSIAIPLSSYVLILGPTVLLVVIGAWLLVYDNGSEINKLLERS